MCEVNSVYLKYEVYTVYLRYGVYSVSLMYEKNIRCVRLILTL